MAATEAVEPARADVDGAPGAGLGDHDRDLIALPVVLDELDEPRAVLLHRPPGEPSPAVDRDLLGGPLRIEVEAHDVERDGVGADRGQLVRPGAVAQQPGEERMIGREPPGQQIVGEEAAALVLDGQRLQVGAGGAGEAGGLDVHHERARVRLLQGRDRALDAPHELEHQRM